MYNVNHIKIEKIIGTFNFYKLYLVNGGSLHKAI